MKLYIFHYHLKPGGVTGVINSSIEAIAAGMPSVDEFVLVTGDLSHTEELLEKLPGKSRLLHIPEIGYLSLSQLSEPRGTLPTERTGREDKAKVREREARRLETRIRQQLLQQLEVKDAVWWVHNYHLGKNPVFTRAILSLAQEREDLRLLLQIHDFPEEARYANLRYLSLIMDRESYPVAPNIRYATINSRDLAKLRSAGLPGEVSFLLPNPIASRSAPATESDTRGATPLGERLAAHFSREFPLFDPEAPIALYPVRTIRRKNIMEAALLLGSLGRPVNLVVTLPGVSQQEKNYSAMVEHAYGAGIIRGLWGVGTSLESAGIRFEDLQAGADLFVSSSVQEGFGFQYVDALRWGRPLVARDLEIIEDLRPMLRGSYFYEGVQVPTRTPSLSGVAPMLKLRYQERLDRLRETVPSEVAEKLEAEIEELLGGETVDFSFLMPQMQYTYVKDLQDPAFRAEVAALNPATLSAISDALTAGEIPGAPEAMEAVRREYGYDAYVNRFRDILASFGSSVSGSPVEESEIQGRLVEQFAAIGRLRLLFE